MDKATFYIDVNDVCIDIDVEPGSTSVYFDNPIYHLQGVNKVFPNVTTLKIGFDVKELKISNRMFPNVRKVISDSKNYMSGNMLIECSDYYSHKLMNSFCLRPDETLNLVNIACIENYALDGCMTTDIINSGLLSTCREFAFTGSALENEELLCEGRVLQKISKNYHTYEIADELKVFVDNIDFSSINTIQITSVKQLILLGECISHVFDDMVIDCTHIYMQELINILCSYRPLIRAKHIHLENNPQQYYISIDGAVYAESGESLIFVSEYREGNYVIPEGTKRILNSALKCSRISSVLCPHSLLHICNNAFQDSHIQNITFNQGLKWIASYAFSECNDLISVVFPESITEIDGHAFYDCANLSSIRIADGLKRIGTSAFKYDYNLKIVELPSSINQVGDECFLNTEEVFIKDCINLNAISTHLNTEIKGKRFTKVHINDNLYYIPKYMAPKYVYCQTWDKFSGIMMYRFARTVKDRQYIAFEVYKETKCNELLQYLQRTAFNICSHMIDDGLESDLAEFIQIIPLKSTTLKRLLNIATSKNMLSIKAYILTELNKNSKEGSFKL